MERLYVPNNWTYEKIFKINIVNSSHKNQHLNLEKVNKINRLSNTKIITDVWFAHPVFSIVMEKGNLFMKFNTFSYDYISYQYK